MTSNTTYLRQSVQVDVIYYTERSLILGHFTLGMLGCQFIDSLMSNVG
jgi:hypothetical protein